MGWFKVDDHYFQHPKVLDAGISAATLNLQGIAYCSANQTDGRIPFSAIPVIAVGRDVSEEIDALLDSGLWRKTAKHYVIHDYLEHQSSRAQIRAKQGKNRDRQRAYRERNAVSNAPRNGKVSAPETEADTDTDVDAEADLPTTGFKDFPLTATSTALVARDEPEPAEPVDPTNRDEALAELRSRVQPADEARTAA